jgi:cytochrome P450
MSAKPLPPGPPGHWLLGNLPEFRQGIVEFYTRCAREYGDVVRFRLGPRAVCLISHPDLIEQVLVTESRNFGKHYALRLNRHLLGNGLLSSDGEFWLRQRRLMQPVFAREKIAAYGQVMSDYTQRMLDGWQDGEERNLHASMTQLTLEIIARCLFDADVTGEAKDVGIALEAAQKSFLAKLNSLLPLPDWLPTPTNLRLRRAVRRLDRIIYGFIAQRRQNKEERHDLLSILLHARDEDGSQMTDKQLRDEAMTLFLAGHDTTALTLTWLWYVLGQHPEVEAKLVEELQRELKGRPPAMADLPRLKYTECVLLESMRLYPAAYAIGREALVECEVGGYRIPKGTAILLSEWVVQRDPRWFDDPEVFRPERWADGLIKRLPKYAYFPFGGGPRVCIGNTFAMLEAALILAAVVQRYHFDLVPAPPLRPRPSLTLRPERGLFAVVRRRS